jgi:hypothetical protein
MDGAVNMQPASAMITQHQAAAREERADRDGEGRARIGAIVVTDVKITSGSLTAFRRGFDGRSVTCSAVIPHPHGPCGQQKRTVT